MISDETVRPKDERPKINSSPRRMRRTGQSWTIARHTSKSIAPRLSGEPIFRKAPIAHFLALSMNTAKGCSLISMICSRRKIKRLGYSQMLLTLTIQAKLSVEGIAWTKTVSL